MKAFERRERIIQELLSEKKVFVSQLSSSFNVTEETIRRDLEKLEKEGILTRNYGGAVLNTHTEEELPYQTRNTRNIEEKKKIAQIILPLIKEGKTIMSDPSSSSFEVLKAITTERKQLTIITNSTNVLQELNHSDHTIISTGGTLRTKSSALIGAVARQTVKNFNVDIALFSCKGLSMSNGITDAHEPESDVKKHMSMQASKVILLADSSKFDRTGFIKLFDFNEIDYLVTDQKPSDEWISFLESQHIAVLYPNDEDKGKDIL